MAAIMAEQAAVKLNRARALIRESQQWVSHSPTTQTSFLTYVDAFDKQAARMNRILLSVELCQIDGRLFETMEKYHVLPPWSGAKVSDASFIGIPH